MTAERIDGKAIAAEVTTRVKNAAAALRTRTGQAPGLAVVLVGDDPASRVYVTNKSRTAKACGFESVQIDLPADTPQAALLGHVAALNADPTIHGILVQLPLPKGLDAGAIIKAIDPDKDADGLHPINVGRLGMGAIEDAFVPCTPAGSMVLLRRAVRGSLAGRHAVVVGRSNLVGKPIAQLLLAADCTVTVAHSRTVDLPGLCRTADILVAAVGRPEMVRGDWIKRGAIVIDVGINRVAGSEGGTRLVGDVATAEAAEVAAAVTPVPGGVGPMTIAMLLANTLRSAYRHAEIEPPDVLHSDAGMTA
ncbi:MAG TPA: bifunctional methylenetetrahydrofolate dehydrogenase/methenyltetrahydrofolate cyclohydrolase FolD [Lichenihabitans sp.]|nr:bifunctional methylenetetrahydrofolate dehydrogenase/methenyltetrahydrofolate cyclohydrolase FolD [Lichenihabitans sp.]